MSHIQLQLFKFFFSSLYRSDSENYYTLLSLPSNCKSNDIRKAYKIQSLIHHPDKTTPTTNIKDVPVDHNYDSFLNIKEAYDVLIDPKRRHQYDILGLEGMKVYNGDYDIHVIITNIMSSPLYDKTKLLSLMLLFMGLLVSGPLLICAKLDGTHSTTQWLVIFLPIWIIYMMLGIHLLIHHAWIQLLKIVCTLTTLVFLTCKWDNYSTLHTVSYALLFIPLYIHELTTCIQSLYIFYNTCNDITKMVTMQCLKANHCFGVFPDDSHQETLSEEHTHLQQSTSLSESQLHVLIAENIEYQQLLKLQWIALHNLRSVLFGRVVVLILVVIQLDYTKHWNWWWISLPLWMDISWNIMRKLKMCCVSKDEESWEVSLDEENGEGNVENMEEEVDKVMGLFEDYKNNDTADNLTSIKKEITDTDVVQSPVDTNDMNDEETNGETKDNDTIHTNEDTPDATKKDPLICIQLGFQFVMCISLILLIIKMNDENWGSHTQLSWDDPLVDDGGYSAFWVVFPVLFVGGCLVGCCGCLFLLPIRDPSFESTMGEIELDDEVHDMSVMKNEVHDKSVLKDELVCEKLVQDECIDVPASLYKYDDDLD